MVTDIVLTVSQVANRLLINPYTVRELLRNGDLVGFKIKDSQWRIRESDLTDFIRRRLERSRTRHTI